MGVYFFKGTERWFCPSSVPVTSGVSILIFSLDSFWGTSPSGSEIYFIFQNLAGQQHIVNLSTRVPFSFGNLKMESSERNEYIEMMETIHWGGRLQYIYVHLIITGEHCSMIIVSGRWTPAKNLLLQPCHFNRCSVRVLLLLPAKSDGIAETAVAPINVEWVENVGATCNLCQWYFCWQSNSVLCGSGIYKHYRCLTFVFTFSKLFFFVT